MDLRQQGQEHTGIFGDAFQHHGQVLTRQRSGRSQLVFWPNRRHLKTVRILFNERAKPLPKKLGHRVSRPRAVAIEEEAEDDDTRRRGGKER